MTYRQLAERASLLARRFGAMRAGGAGAGPRWTAAVCMTPGPEAVAALYGLWRAEYAVMPLHERLTAPEVDHACRTVQSQLLLNDAMPQGMRRAFGRGDLLAGFPDVIAMIFTSGSSGAPSAVGFGNEALAASAEAVARRLRLGRRDRWGLCLSMGHIGGLSLVVRAIRTRASVRLWSSFSAKAVVRAMLEGRVTHVAVVPVMLRRILERLRGGTPPETLRCVLVGGAATSPGLLQEAREAGLPVATTWGMSETASQVATAPPELAAAHPGTVGRPLDGIRLRRGRGGVLEVSGPTLASMVVKGPDAAPEPLTRGPWFATRDLGRVDDDGLVRIDGRADGTIVTGGLNVSPAHVERVIETMPGVSEAVVFGVPDEDWGEVVAAVVEADPTRVTAEDVNQHCRTRLARGRCPSRIAVTDALVRTRSGKAVRVDLDRYLAPDALLRSGGPGAGPMIEEPNP